MHKASPYGRTVCCTAVANPPTSAFQELLRPGAFPLFLDTLALFLDTLAMFLGSLAVFLGSLAVFLDSLAMFLGSLDLE